ncbi:TIM-barrel domain-containing protein [Alkalibacterium putridalgicola]|uniref:glycoside hydrolase family 31 protein n=1 Tax=Alkalibacterium putridalgicola TaxID=426703 RepID=UPI0034CEBEA6
MKQPEIIDKSIVQGERYRFTVITDKLIRMEFSEEGIFEDRSTQIVINRFTDDVDFEVKDSENMVEILTDAFHLCYMKEEAFAPHNLFVDARYRFTEYSNRWYYGQYIPTLKGSLRTVDEVDGEAELEESIISKAGYAVLDDSNSFIFNQDDTISPRGHQQKDIYFFAYGRDYLKAIKDFYRLSGHPPLLPRYALGNWWSRYWTYSEQSYLALIDRFEVEDIPFSVAVLDMDWHLTDIPSKYGSGWTGYTWNKEIFPDPESFLTKLHDRGFSVTLNVHPADGIRGFEEQYDIVADKLDLNKQMEEPASFDLMNETFRETYFEDVNHPLEEQGVDFWWIDWQQGEYSRSIVDPLWLLNHYYYEDLKKRENDALILSRYAGPGSQRYPVGFSGDSVISWESLRFQPYLTATSSNIGFTWWSHDIGGNNKGHRDEELILRWVQFGVFSPINRLHSSKSAFTSKEPWNYTDNIRKQMVKFLRLRHALIPYLYTLNVRNSEEGIPVIQPLYYNCAMDEAGYNNKNEYFFGDQLLVLPITHKRDEETLYGSERVYLPEGMWFDIFTNLRYGGKVEMKIYRDESMIPAFARAGCIIPLDHKPTETRASDLPEEIEWLIYPGQSNAFDLVEDQNGVRSITTLELNVLDQRLTIKTEDPGKILPQNRKHIIQFNASKKVEVTSFENGKVEIARFSEDLNRTSVTIIPQNADHTTIRFDHFKIIKKQDISSELYKRLHRAQVRHYLKNDLLSSFDSDLTDFSLLALVDQIEEEYLSESLFELLYIKNS